MFLQCEGTHKVSSSVAESRCWDNTNGGEVDWRSFPAGDAVPRDLLDQVFGSHDMESVGDKTQHGCWYYMQISDVNASTEQLNREIDFLEASSNQHEPIRVEIRSQGLQVALSDSFSLDRASNSILKWCSWLSLSSIFSVCCNSVSSSPEHLSRFALVTLQLERNLAHQVSIWRE